MTVKIDMNTLDKAIKHFNEWEGVALIYLNTNEGYFETEVYHNDVQATETVLAEGICGVYRKNDRGSIYIGGRRKQYILEKSGMLMEGLDAATIDYRLMDKYPPDAW